MNFLKSGFTSRLSLLATPFVFIWIGICFISKIAEGGIHGFLHPEAEQRLYLLTQNTPLQYRLFSVHINDAYQGSSVFGLSTAFLNITCSNTFDQRTSILGITKFP